MLLNLKIVVMFYWCFKVNKLFFSIDVIGTKFIIVHTCMLSCCPIH